MSPAVLERKTKSVSRNHARNSHKHAEHGTHNFIEGKWRKASRGGGSFPNINPATGEVIAYFPESTANDVEEAICAARGAFDSWRRIPAAHRGEILLKAMEILREHKEEYARVETREMGKILKE